MDQASHKKLKNIVGKKVKILDYREENIPLIEDSWVLVLEIDKEKWELSGPGGYDGESRFRLEKLEEESHNG